MEVNGVKELLCFPHSSEYLNLCLAEQRHSYRFVNLSDIHSRLNSFLGELSL